MRIGGKYKPITGIGAGCMQGRGRQPLFGGKVGSVVLCPQPSSFLLFLQPDSSLNTHPFHCAIDRPIPLHLVLPRNVAKVACENFDDSSTIESFFH